MSVFAPDTDLRLIKSPLTFGDGHQLDFANATAQANYFLSLPGVSYTDFTYQRKDNIIRVPDLAENIYQYNYVMYRNKASAKWFYAFITKIEFINQNCTHVRIKTDVFQTWQFDFTFLPTLVRRECVSDDSLWLHTLPESVPTGDTIVADEVELSSETGTGALNVDCSSAVRFDVNYYVAIMANETFSYISTVVPSGTKTAYVGGAACGCVIYGVSFAQLQPFLDAVNQHGDTADVVAVFPVPRMCVGFTAITHTLPPPDTSQVAWNNDVGFLFDGTMATKVAAKNTTVIDGYTPKNKKLFCYPYNYMLLRSGDSAQTLKYELFNNKASAVATFNRRFSIGNPPVFGVSVAEYEGISNNVYRGVSIQNWSPISWSYDIYKEYIALHANSLAFSTLKTAAGVGSAFMGGGFTGALEEGVATILPKMVEFADMQLQPESRRGQLSGNFLGYANKNGIYVERRTIRAEYAKIVDEYFSRYGYRVDTLKTPSFKQRTNWDFVQTERCAIKADIPQDDAEEIQGLFNTGLTVWHNPANFGNYNVSNTPV